MDSEIRVLHVDDDPEFTDLTARLLERQDDRFTVETATDPTDALAQLTSDIDCIVSDYEMPRMDGLVFLDRVREMRPDLPFILFTGKGSEAVASDALTKGATDYLQKQSGTEQYDLLANRIGNVVEQYRSQHRLDRQREEYQQLFEQAPVMFAILHENDGEPIFEDCNDRFAEKLGYDPDGLRGRSMCEFYTDESVARAIDGDGFARALAGEFETEERTLRSKDGDTIDVLLRAVPRADATGTVTGILALYVDVTERKRHERELTRKTQAMDQAPVGITMTDPHQNDNPLVYANDKFLELTGYSRGDVVGWNHRVLQGPETSDEPVAELRRAIEAGESTTVELRNYREDDTTFWNRVSIAPLHDETGTVTNWIGYQEDVSERKAREQELETTTERMRHALDVTDSIIYEMNRDTGTEARHGPFERLFGIESDRVRTTDAFYEQCVHPEDRAHVRRHQTDCADEADESIEFEFRTHPDRGDVRWIYSEAYVQDGPGGTRQMVGLDTDITERKEREQELERLKQEYESVFTHVQDSLFLIDVEENGTGEPEFRLRRINPANASLMGVSLDEVRGKTPMELFGPDVGQDVADNYARCLDRGASISYEEQVPGEGERRTFETTLTPVEIDGDTTKIVGVAHDITERKRRERELAELEEAVETICANVPLMLFAFDADGVFTRSEGRALSRIGFEPGEAVGRSVFELFADQPTILEHCEQALDGQQVTTTAEIGDTVFETWYQPLFDGEELSRVVGISYDITEQKQRERDLERERDRLEEFASIVSHDLQNPLQVLDARLALLDEDCESDHTDSMERAIDRMETIIDDTLTLARQGQVVSETDTVDFDAIVTESWNGIESGSATLEMDTPGTIEADESRLRHVFENLLQNALDHGGEDVTIRVGQLADGDSTGFYIEDDGPGIPAERREEVFDPGITTTPDGSGFGLAIVRSIVDAHGWDVRATDSDDGGARFEITQVPVVAESTV